MHGVTCVDRAWDRAADLQQARPRRLTNTASAADIAGVSVRTIYRWIRSNRVEWVRTPGGHLRVYVDTLLKADDVT